MSGGRTAQLFVGRLSKDVRTRDLEEIFSRYGRLARCDIKFGSAINYAFIDYEDKRDGEDAVKYEHGRELRGRTIVVEWAKGPNYRHYREGDRDGGGYRGRGGGHNDRGRSRSRSRDRRRSKSRSKSPRRRRNSDRDRNRSASKSDDSPPRRRSRSPAARNTKRRNSDKRSVSRSKSRSRSGSSHSGRHSVKNGN